MTENRIIDINKMLTVHLGTFAFPNAQATTLKTKEPEFLHTHRE